MRVPIPIAPEELTMSKQRVTSFAVSLSTVLALVLPAAAEAGGRFGY
jgi:hypothetical protein